MRVGNIFALVVIHEGSIHESVQDVLRIQRIYIKFILLSKQRKINEKYFHKIVFIYCAFTFGNFLLFDI